MRIGILGTRGIPNYHGGFEQFAENFSLYLADKGHEVYVYNSSLHPYQKGLYKGVNIIHCKDLENKLGTGGQFLYDFNCILDAHKRNFDILLQLGYTSSSIWYRFIPKTPIVITNMDGLEWKRSKYSKPVRSFLKYAEYLAVKSSDYLISDSIGIQNYIQKKYNKESKYIAYGSDLIDSVDDGVLKEYGLFKYSYNMLIARLEPENNIEVILNGVQKSKQNTPFIVIGKYDSTPFGKYIYEKFKTSKRISFLGGIYNQDHLNVIRYFSNLYFHGHTVGGTNPSLLEAMASECLIVAHNNEFNKYILKSNGFYFESEHDVSMLIETLSKNNNKDLIKNNISSIASDYSWEQINKEYLDFFLAVIAKNK
jgi:glycosyltransferase involved in cell wall biosynthesis